VGLSISSTVVGCFDDGGSGNSSPAVSSEVLLQTDAFDKSTDSEEFDELSAVAGGLGGNFPSMRFRSPEGRSSNGARAAIAGGLPES
jgi:hypothetical protein